MGLTGLTGPRGLKSLGSGHVFGHALSDPCKPLPPADYNPVDVSCDTEPFVVGKTLGHYEILEPLGKGGMGEVYRARDTKLDRDVAIKVLPEDFAADADRLARFEREAKLLASLNHANIAAIYGLEDEGDQRFIVMEVVEGETLAERTARSVADDRRRRVLTDS